METFADIVLIAILAASTVSGFRRGFVRSLVDLIGGIIALIAAMAYAPHFAVWAVSLWGPSMPDWMRNPVLSKIVAALILFAVFEAVIQTAASLLNRVCRLPVLRQLNSLLGGGIGFCKGAVIVLLLCASLRTALPVSIQGSQERDGTAWQKIAFSQIYRLVSNRNPVYMLFQSDLWNEVGKNEI